VSVFLAWYGSSRARLCVGMLGVLGDEGFYAEACWLVVAVAGTYTTVGVGHDGFDYEFACDRERELYSSDIRG